VEVNILSESGGMPSIRLIGVKMVLFFIFNAHLSFMSCPQHLYYKYYKYLNYRSHSHNCKVTKYELWSKTVYFRLCLPSCFGCLLLSLFVVMTFFCFFHILHRSLV